MHLTQSFGDGNTLSKGDNISSVEYDSTGCYLASGDQGGRIVIFKAMDVKNHLRSKEKMYHSHKNCSKQEYNNNNTICTRIWSPYCQFQSHTRDFDFLKSLEIEERINQIRFCKTGSPNNISLLSTNDKTIKLWKICPANEFYTNNSVESLSKGNGLILPKINKLYHDKYNMNSLTATPKHEYKGSHDYHINSLSICSDMETFLTADDLKINWRNYEYSDSCYNIIDIKPAQMEELIEVITVAKFHHSNCYEMMLASSRGIIKLFDLRQYSNYNQNCRILEKKNSNKSSFSEIVSSISDINYSSCGRYIVSRDYLTVKIWDVNKIDKPVSEIIVGDKLIPILNELYESEAIFDKFQASFSPDDNHILTGGYNNQYSICNIDGSKIDTYELHSCNFSLDKNCGNEIEHITKRMRDINLDNYAGNTLENEIRTDQNISNLRWHPIENSIVVAGKTGLCMYSL